MRPTGWLVRHTQSLANTGIKCENHQLVKLSPVGQQQANWLGKKLLSIFPPDHPESIDAVIHSPFPRTRETIQPVIDGLLESGRQLNIETWPIQEFVNLPHSQSSNATFETRWPLIQAYWERNDPYEQQEDTESFADLLIRVDGFIHQLQQLKARRPLICSHGIFLTAVQWRLLYYSEELHPDLTTAMRDFQTFLDQALWKNAELRPFSVNQRGLIRLRKGIRPPSFAHKSSLS